MTLDTEYSFRPQIPQTSRAMTVIDRKSLIVVHYCCSLLFIQPNRGEFEGFSLHDRLYLEADKKRKEHELLVRFNLIFLYLMSISTI